MSRRYQCMECNKMYTSDGVLQSCYCGASLTDISTNENTKEKAMQEFENGQEVEVESVGDKEWILSTYMCYDNEECKHVVRDFGGDYHGRETEQIRPVQLICEKAREYIISNKDKKIEFIADSVEIKKELQNFLFGLGIGWGGGKQNYIQYLDKERYCIEDEVCLCYNSSGRRPMLNLKTGEVVQCEGDSASICIIHGCCNKKNEGAFIGDICMPCFEMITTGKVNHSGSFIGDYHRREINLNRQLKEKGAEIKNLKSTLRGIKGMCGDHICLT